MVVHVSAFEAEARGLLQVQGQPDLLTEIQVCLGDIVRPSLRKGVEVDY